MSASTMCRVCLVDNLTLFGVRKDLQNTYERIIRRKYINDGYPVSMCYICLSALQKCYTFVETARDTNKFLKQWYSCGQPNEMRMVKPLTTYSVTKAEVVSLGNKHSLNHDVQLETLDIKQEPREEIPSNVIISMEEIEPSDMTLMEVQPSGITSTEYEGMSLNHYIKIEDVDLESDHIEYNMDVHIEKTDMDEQTIINDLFLEDPKASTSALEVTSDRQTDPLLNTENNDIFNLNRLPSQVDNITKLSKKIHSNTKAKTNKIVKSKNIELKTTIKKKQDKNVTNSTPLNTAKSSKVNTDNNKYIEMYKYCNVCNLKCLTNNELAKHMRLHDSSRPHACDVCGYRFGYTGHLYNHKATIHGIGSVNEYFCDKCEFKSINKLNLTRHLTTHTGEKPFSCNVCNFKCSHKSHLYIHMRIHTGEKPFSCDVCDYKCAEKGSLKSHMRKHTGEKPFSCDVCSYRCVYKSDLNKHKRIHTGVKPYCCTKCDYKCVQKTTLNTHMRTHNGLKPFSCDICDYTCVRSNTMKRHLLVKHLYNEQEELPLPANDI